MKANFEVDTTKCTEMCKELSKLTGASFSKTVEYEVGRVIEKTIALTPAAKPEKIRAAQANAQFSSQPSSLYTPSSAAGQTARAKAARTKKNLLLYWMQNRYPDELWQAILEARKKTLSFKLKARGFAKWTWASMAQKLGIGIRLPGFVSTAGGVIKADPVAVKKEVEHGRVGIWIENASTVVQSKHVRGGSALQRAINGRVSYFKTNLRRKVFESMATITKRYPGVKVGGN